MEKKTIILVADTAFASREMISRHNLISVYPREKNDGAYRATMDELLFRSKQQSLFYDSLLSKLIPSFQKVLPEAQDEVKSILRPVIVNLTGIFTDRAIRLLHRLNQADRSEISFAEVENFQPVHWLSDFGQSWHFNQYIIQKILSSLNIAGAKIFEKKDYFEFPKNYDQKNLLFRPEKSGLSGFFIKVINRWYNFLEKYPNKKAKFINIGFGADKFYLSRRGFFGPFGYLQGHLHSELIRSERNQSLRNKLHEETKFIIADEYKNFFGSVVSVSEQDLLKLSDAFSAFFIEWFPVGFLEGFNVNFEQAKKAIDSKTTTVIGHDVTSTQGYFVSTAARLAGKKIIGVQHGGHYGYIEDLASVAQIEYPFYDQMITWGWTKIDKHLPQCSMLPLPSPKLSERPLKSNYFDFTNDQKDILYFSNLFHRFPNNSTNGHSRVDFIDEISNSQESLMASIHSQSLTIDHKPYHMRFVDLYPEHYRRMENAGGKGYRLIQSVQKGLTIDLIKTCRIVLWDQIGSGTLECFTSGVPTVIFWERIYSRESEFSRSFIAELERCGVIHSDPMKLALEIKNYLANPKSWMENTERKNAIENFCQNFALSHPEWHCHWKEQLKKWS